MLALWRRYFLVELFKRFSIILLFLLALYITIDSASQIGSWRHQSLQIPQWHYWCLHYLYELLYRADVLLPIALLLAALHTLVTLQQHGELVALLCSGVSMKKIANLFLAPALLLTVLLFLNNQYGVPLATHELHRWQRTKKNSSSTSPSSDGIQELSLRDGSRLLFRDYDDGVFSDLFWVQSGDSIIRMRQLFTFETPPRGTFVEELRRGGDGTLQLVDTAEERHLPMLQWHSTAILPDEESLLQLWSQLPLTPHHAYSYREAHLATTFWLRMLLPWLALLTLAIALPYALLQGRRLPSFALYGAALFAFVAFHLFLDAAAVMSKRQIIAPPWALLPPLTVTTAWACYNYCRLR